MNCSIMLEKISTSAKGFITIRTFYRFWGCIVGRRGVTGVPHDMLFKHGFSKKAFATLMTHESEKQYFVNMIFQTCYGKKNENVIYPYSVQYKQRLVLFQFTFSEHVMRDSCGTSSTNNATPELVKCTVCDETFSGVASLLYEGSQQSRITSFSNMVSLRKPMTYAT